MISEFDAVGAFDVIEHIDREADAIAEMRRALAPDGVIFLTVPQHPWLWSRVDEIDDHKRRYRRGELSAKLRDSGFSVLCDTSFMFFLLPAMMAQRLAANRSSTYYPDVEYALPRPVDWLFERVLDLERHAINAASASRSEAAALWWRGELRPDQRGFSFPSNCAVCA